MDILAMSELEQDVQTVAVAEPSTAEISASGNTKKIQTLVLDAGPLITQSASSLQQHAVAFYTTPGVYSELKDETVRQQLLIWNDTLKIRHPTEKSIKRVTDFAKLTGDYAVLSANDLHIIALAYELECEQNGGEWRLRKFPGEKLVFKSKKTVEEPATEEIAEITAEVTNQEQAPTSTEVKAKKPRRRGGKKQREKREAQLQKELEEQDQQEEQVEAQEAEAEAEAEPVSEKAVDTEVQSETSTVVESEDALVESYDDSDDDGEWITPENLMEEILKDDNEQLQESLSKNKVGPLIKVAISTGDFACQNVSMQLGLNLMNSMSGKQIKRVRNYMYRCHACFRLTPIPKNGQPKHFCPKCGGATLLRCAVSVDNVTGKITPHLKANFQWIKRGEKFTLSSPLSKNSIKRQGNGGYQHNKQNRHKVLQNPILLREDQKEYQQALKDDEWQRRKNDKMLQEWIGGGSADNYVSPFSTLQNIRPSGVKVGKGRFVNSSKGKRT